MTLEFAYAGSPAQIARRAEPLCQQQRDNLF